MSLRPYKLVVNYISEGDVANLLRGYIEVGDEKIRFTGVAYGRFGGQNVSPQLSPAAKKKVELIFGDADRFEEDLQMRLVKGEFETKAPKGEMEGHHHAHMG